jgi:hypothetical protein
MGHFQTGLFKKETAGKLELLTNSVLKDSWSWASQNSTLPCISRLGLALLFVNSCEPCTYFFILFRLWKGLVQTTAFFSLEGKLEGSHITSTHTWIKKTNTYQLYNLPLQGLWFDTSSGKNFWWPISTNVCV